MNVLIAALELAPYVCRTPASEAVANLAKSLKLLGHEVTVAVPKLEAYESAGLMAARQLSPLALESGGEAVLFDVQLPSGVKLTLVDVDGLQFDEGQPLEEQAAPLGGYSCAIASLVSSKAGSEDAYEVVHAHDAAAGLSLLSVGRLSSVANESVARVLSVHDAERSGEFPAEAGQALQIPEERIGTQGFGAREGLCLLKGLVSEADVLVVPSETYGRQMKAPEKYGALSRAFQAVDLTGIEQGVDYSVYNPATDAALTSRFDAPNPANKGRNKIAVLDELGLEFDVGRPLVFCEDSPFSDSSIETVLGALPALIRNDVSLILSAPEELKKENEALLAPFAERVKWISSPTAAKRRRILAASDFYLSVAKRDPTGQRLKQAARYGAIPVAFRTDAVTDALVDADAELKTGTGLIFEAMTQRAVSSAVARAVAAYRSPRLSGLLSRVMRQDLGWDRAARRHAQIYRNAVARA